MHAYFSPLLMDGIRKLPQTGDIGIVVYEPTTRKRGVHAVRGEKHHANSTPGHSYPVSDRLLTYRAIEGNRSSGHRCHDQLILYLHATHCKRLKQRL